MFLLTAKSVPALLLACLLFFLVYDILVYGDFNMKKRLFSVFLFFFIIIAGLISGCSMIHLKETDPSSDLPHLKIGYATYPPFMNYDEHGNVVGVDADFANEVCRRIGYQAEFIPIEWTRKDSLLREHEIDCIWCGFSMDGLNKEYLWAGPYMKSRHLPVVLAESPFQTSTDLTGKSVAVLANSQTEYFLIHRQKLIQVPTTSQIYCFPDLLEVRSALLNGYCDAIYANSVVWTILLKDELEHYRFLTDDQFISDLGVAFATDADPDLIQKINEALNEMKSDGTACKILQTYQLEADCPINAKGEPTLP